MQTRLAPCRESSEEAELTGQSVLEKSQHKQGAGHETRSGSSDCASSWVIGGGCYTPKSRFSQCVQAMHNIEKGKARTIASKEIHGLVHLFLLWLVPIDSYRLWFWGHKDGISEMTPLPIIYCKLERKVSFSNTVKGSSLTFEFLFCSVPQLPDAGSVLAVILGVVVSSHLGNKGEGV